MKQSMDLVSNVLINYNVQPDFIEEIRKVIKVYTNKGVFALKQVTFSEKQRNQFMYAVQSLHKNNYRYAVPILLTNEGDCLVNKQAISFYVMPWLEDKRSQKQLIDRLNDVIKEAARLHNVTTVHGKINETYFKHFYETVKAKNDKRKLDYERLIEKYEKRVYMSPFELLFCTSFIQLMRLEELASIKIEDWYEATREKKQDRVVLCHGSLSPSHLLYDDHGRGCLLNFERTFTASPIYDLYYFFRKILYNYPQYATTAAELYGQYNRQNRLTEDEKLLLDYYLLQTEKIHKIIHEYEKQSSLSERIMVVKLQRAIWQMQAQHTLLQQITNPIEEAESDLQEDRDTPSL